MAKFITVTQYNKPDTRFYLNLDHITAFYEGASTSLHNTQINMDDGEQFFVAEPIVRIIRMITIANNEDESE